MIKIWLFILILYTAVCSAPKCFNEYASAAEKIEKNFAKSHITSYDFYPTNMFPFFCFPKDIQDTIAQYTPVFLCSFSNVIYLGMTKYKWPQIVITTVQYIKTGNAVPDRIYTAFFFKRDPFTKEWLSDKKNPISITFIWSPSKQQYLVR